MLMPVSNWIVLGDGQVYPMDEENAVDASLLNPGENEDQMDSGQGILNRTISKFAKQAYRTILLTYRDFTENEYNDLKAENGDFEKESDRQCLETDLVAVAIWGI